MGKKGKAHANGKPSAKASKSKDLGDADFDQMLEKLSETTSKNEALQGTKGPVSTREHKKERKDKLKHLQHERQEQAESEARTREQMMQFLDMFRRQQGASDFLETATTTKDVDTEEDDTVRISSVAMQGWRQSMEDAHLIEKAIENNGETVSLYGVFDGHSGSDVAIYAAANLLKKLQAEESWAAKDYEKALRNAFLALDKEMLEKQMQSGSTATVCLIAAGKVYCANAGDSRAVMCKNGEVVALSEDHKPLSDVEKERIEKAGHNVQDVGGIGRVDGMLAVSRGFGDFSFKNEAHLAAEDQAVTVNPDITVNELKGTEYIIIACDGIWDSLSNEEIIAKTKSDFIGAKSPDAIADLTAKLFDEIMAPQAGMIGSDNMSMITIQYKENCS
ncbi:putative protein phosphatase 2C 5 [Diplonema papillatum]|nr:putative protein phosphatase 2C 5 [Diplonema papillatum]